MGSADFSQFVVTTANGTACETSTLKVRALSPHLPATFTGTSSNFWTSSFLADLSVFPSLICGSCSSGQGFAYSFLQIPPHDGHPCCSAMYFVVAYAYSGLSPVRARPWRAYQKKIADLDQLFFRGDNQNRTGDTGVADPCLTAWLCRHMSSAISSGKHMTACGHMCLSRRNHSAKHSIEENAEHFRDRMHCGLFIPEK